MSEFKIYLLRSPRQVTILANIFRRHYLASRPAAQPRSVNRDPKQEMIWANQKILAETVADLMIAVISRVA